MQQEASTLRSLTLFVSSHFMFNVLGKLQSEILMGDKHEAILTMTQYTKILRQACALSKNDTNSMAEEGLFLEHYLQLEQRRFEEFSFTYHIIGFDSPSHHMAPFMIQPFVELAVLSSLGAQNNVITLSYDKLQNTICIQSAMHNEGVSEKLEEKCETALQRLQIYNHTYTKQSNHLSLNQTINL